MSPILPANAREHWIEKNYHYAFESLYVTNLNLERLDKSLYAALEYDILTVLENDARVEIFTCVAEEQVIQHWLSTHFNRSLSFKSEERLRTMSGNYLRILVPYKVGDEKSYAENLVITLVNVIRLKYGFAAAFEKAEEVIHDLHQDNRKKHTEPFISAIRTDKMVVELFFQNSLTSEYYKTDIIPLKAEANLLLDHALKNHNKLHRFLFLWMALEVQLKIGKKDNQGKERGKYCRQELGSTILSDEMCRLHKLRGDYVHDGTLINEEDLGVAISHLLNFIRISTLGAGQTRQQLVSLLEKEIKGGTFSIPSDAISCLITEDFS
jgi:hypothetical protein